MSIQACLERQTLRVTPAFTNGKFGFAIQTHQLISQIVYTETVRIFSAGSLNVFIIESMKLQFLHLTVWRFYHS